MKFLRFLITPIILIDLLTVSLLSQASSISPQISVSGTGKIFESPDQAILRLSVTSTMPTSKQALSSIGKKVSQFVETLEELKLKENALIAGTLNLSPRYDYRNNQQHFAGIHATRDLSITIDELKLIPKLMDIAIKSGVDQIHGISYQSSNETNLRLRARDAAIADSKSKASEIAKAYGATLGPIISIDYLDQNEHQGHQGHSQMRQAMDDSQSGGPYIPGEITIQDNIRVIFSLVPN